MRAEPQMTTALRPFQRCMPVREGLRYTPFNKVWIHDWPIIRLQRIIRSRSEFFALEAYLLPSHREADNAEDFTDVEVIDK